MINHKIHENGWTVIIDNFDLKFAMQEDINQVSKLIASNTCVLIRNQSLSIIKGNDTRISDETRYIIMIVHNNHTNGYDKQIAYLYNALPIEISNPIIRHLRTL